MKVNLKILKNVLIRRPILTKHYKKFVTYFKNGTVVEQSTHDHKFGGSNPADAGTERERKKLFDEFHKTFFGVI